MEDVKRAYFYVNGGLIENHLSALGWSQAKYAKDLHISQTMMNRVIRRKTQTSLDVIDRFCQTFGLTRDEIIDDPKWIKEDVVEETSQDDIEDEKEKFVQEFRGTVAQRLGKYPDGYKESVEHKDSDKETLDYIHQIMEWKGISRPTRARMMNLIVENWLMEEGEDH